MLAQLVLRLSEAVDATAPSTPRWHRARALQQHYAVVQRFLRKFETNGFKRHAYGDLSINAEPPQGYSALEIFN